MYGISLSLRFSIDYSCGLLDEYLNTPLDPSYDVFSSIIHRHPQSIYIPLYSYQNHQPLPSFIHVWSKLHWSSSSIPSTVFHLILLSLPTMKPIWNHIFSFFVLWELLHCLHIIKLQSMFLIKSPWRRFMYMTTTSILLSRQHKSIHLSTSKVLPLYPMKLSQSSSRSSPLISKSMSQCDPPPSIKTNWTYYMNVKTTFKLWVKNTQTNCDLLFWKTTRIVTKRNTVEQLIILNKYTKAKERERIHVSKKTSLPVDQES